MYPVRIRSGEHWSGAAPGTAEPVPLPATQPAGDAIHVPAGWAVVGGDLERDDTLPRQKVWVDGFAIMRHPVRCDAWLAFLDDLDRCGQGDRAEQCAPRIDDRILWTRGSRGWELPEGWRLDHPVRAVTWEATCAYAHWLADDSGLPWRLPTEIEWEKAARGTDERLYPWGDFADPTWCCVADSHAGRPAVAPVGAYPADVSPYGVRGMGGNVRDWCLAATHPPHQLQERAAPNDRIVRGGYWLGITQFARCTLRYRLPTPTDPGVGCRLVYSLDSPT